MNKQSYLRVDLGSRGEVEEVQLTQLDQPLIDCLRSMYEELVNEVGDPDYLSEFANFEVNEDGSLGYIIMSEEEAVYFIGVEKFPENLADPLEYGVDDETVIDMIDDLFEW